MHPITFKPQMLEALHLGSKTQTRRTGGLTPINGAPDQWEVTPISEGGKFRAWCSNRATGQLLKVNCPFGMRGSILYIKESYRIKRLNPGVDWKLEYFDGNTNVVTRLFDDVSKEADYMAKYASHSGKMPFTGGMLMPRHAARTWLVVTDIRLERLQDISAGDALEEGVETINEKQADGQPYYRDYLQYNEGARWKNPVLSFKSLIQSISGVEIWDHNPWVWVVSYGVLTHEAPIEPGYSYSCQHMQSEEEWYVVDVDLERGQVMPAGWPESYGNLVDCRHFERIKPLTEQEINYRNKRLGRFQAVP